MMFMIKTVTVEQKGMVVHSFIDIVIITRFVIFCYILTFVIVKYAIDNLFVLDTMQ